MAASQGLKIYSHLSDHFASFGSRIMSATAGEAPYVLDGLMLGAGALPLHEHYTDTGGATDHVFALCHLLGFRFVPRLRDIADRKLGSIAGAITYGASKASWAARSRRRRSKPIGMTSSGSSPPLRKEPLRPPRSCASWPPTSARTGWILRWPNSAASSGRYLRSTGLNSRLCCKHGARPRGVTQLGD
jgi:hypothetical protein